MEIDLDPQLNSFHLLSEISWGGVCHQGSELQWSDEKAKQSSTFQKFQIDDGSDSRSANTEQALYRVSHLFLNVFRGLHCPNGIC